MVSPYLKTVLILLVVITSFLNGCDSRRTADQERSAFDLAPSRGIVEAGVERRGPLELRIWWRSEPPDLPVQVFASTHPDSFDTDAEPITDIAGGTAITIQQPFPDRRPYFLLYPYPGRPHIVAERRLPLSGQDNFRDLGGYRSRDGRRIKWGRLYRSGELNELSEADQSYLESLGLVLVCDLRSDAEVVRRGRNQLPEGTREIAQEIVTDEALVQNVSAALESGDFSLIDPGLILGLYRNFVRRWTPQFAAVVTRMTDPAQTPAVVHCTRGKDRTSFASALLLWTLGVPTETVLEDYLFTNFCRQNANRMEMDRLRQVAAAKQSIPPAAVDVTPLEPLFILRPEYLMAALEVIEEDYGSVEGYLTAGMGFSTEELARIRDHFLE